MTMTRSITGCCACPPRLPDRAARIASSPCLAALPLECWAPCCTSVSHTAAAPLRSCLPRHSTMPLFRSVRG